MEVGTALLDAARANARCRIARLVVTGALGLALTGIPLVGFEVQAGAVGGPGAMSATPSKAVAGSTGASFSFTYSAPKGTTVFGSVLVQFPSAWTAPRTSRGSGHVAVIKHSCAKASLGKITATKPRTVAIAVSCRGGKGFTLTYTGAVVPKKAAAYQFAASLQARSSTTPLTSSPTVTVMPATLSSLVVSPSSGTTGAPRNDGTGTDDFTIPAGHQYVQYSAAGYDKYANLISDVTAQSTFTVGPGASPCNGSLCSALGTGPWTVHAKDGVATGQATVVGDLSLDTFTCRGLHFDVDQNDMNGCELHQTSTGTTKATAPSLGAISCSDGNGHTVNTTSDLASDTRAHKNPAVAGFDVTVGAAPSWQSIDATGGSLCTNDIVLKLTVTGSVKPICYKFTVTTDKFVYSLQVDSTGNASITAISGQYSDNSTIYLEVQKTCAASSATSEHVSYVIDGHL